MEATWAKETIYERRDFMVNLDIYLSLFKLIMSDTAVLSVARALHVLSKLTDPDIANKELIFMAMEQVSSSHGRKNRMSCLRPAFVGIALLDANIHGLRLGYNLMKLDPNAVYELEQASVLEGIFPLCENTALAPQICAFEEQMCACWRERSNIKVDSDNPAHLEQLKKLWVAGSLKPFPGKVSPLWKELGFQGENPMTDFRSMGMFALDQLVYFAENCSTEARMVFGVQSSAENSEFYYPVASGGIIVAQMVLNAVEARVKDGEPVPVILGGGNGMAHLWVAVFRHMDTIFVERKLSYLQFGDLTKVVMTQLNDVLSQSPLTGNEVAAFLKAADENSPTIVGSTKKKRPKVLSSVMIQEKVRERTKPKQQPADKLDVLKPEFNSSTPVKSSKHHMKVDGKKLRKAARDGDAKKVIEIIGRDKAEGYALVNDADPDSRLTPLHLACIGGHSDCAVLLCGAGAALECVAGSGLGTPLHCAADRGSVQIVTALLDGGAKLNSTATVNARTPLMIAAAKGHSEVVTLLIQRGADKSIVDAEGNTAVDLWKGSETIAKQLGSSRRKKRVSLTLPLASSHNFISPRATSPERSSLMERQIEELKAENLELRALLVELTQRVEILEAGK